LCPVDDRSSYVGVARLASNCAKPYDREDAADRSPPGVLLPALTK
jgi:hypothetical protein